MLCYAVHRTAVALESDPPDAIMKLVKMTKNR